MDISLINRFLKLCSIIQYLQTKNENVGTLLQTISCNMERLQKILTLSSDRNDLNVLSPSHF